MGAEWQQSIYLTPVALKDKQLIRRTSDAAVR
jgi:hypothetical protein